MTRHWADYPITNTTPRKKAHITDLMNAYEERIRFLRANTYYFLNETEYPLPEFWYDETTRTKAWGTYPKADPAHWPPHESPDNEFKNGHIYGTRGLLVGLATSGDGSYAAPAQILSDATILDTTRRIFFRHFIDIDAGKYKVYNAGDIGAFLTDAIGSSSWSDGTLTAGSTSVRIPHVMEQQDCWEALRQIAILPSTLEYRTKSVTTDYYDTIAEAHSAGKTAWAAGSWGSWTEYEFWDLPGGTRDRVYMREQIGTAGGQYRATLSGNEIRYTFDLDLEISGMGWNILPPLSAKLVTYGLDTGYDDIADILIGCTTTSATNSLSHQDADGRGYLLDSDVTSYVGSGHGSEAFVFSTMDEFSSDEWDAINPGEVSTNTVVLNKSRLGETGTGLYWDTLAFIVIEPNWHYGTA